MIEASADRENLRFRDELRALKQRLFEMEREVRERDAGERALPEHDFDVLACRVDAERVALSLDEVREVLPVAEMLPLPESPAWMCGMMDLGSRTVPVLDVSARFRRTRRAVELTDLVVVCRGVPRDMGLLVQEVFDLQRIPRSRVSSPADEVPHATYVRGTIRDNDGQMLLLSLARLIDASDVPGSEGTVRS